ncbi:MAG: hypothetical protein JXQ29_00325 [Planctomycetes bacterium]|nr:hypothetical protein [Planctomycetota bacterium]
MLCLRVARVFALFPIVFALASGLETCSHPAAPPPEKEDWARPGGGEDAELARKLAAGKLESGSGEESGVRAMAVARSGGPVGARGPTPAPTPTPTPAPTPSPTPAPSTAPAEEAESDDAETSIFGRVEQKLDDAGATRPGARPDTGRWQRSEHRPSFARVYVGGGNSLELVRMRVTVSIEGARARTVVDHIFRNPHDQRLEGTFEYPLPPNASASYYAMFLTASQAATPDFFPRSKVDELPPGALATLAPPEVGRCVDPATWGELREACVVSRETGRRVYEEVVRRKIDPALLEYAGGNTFSGRVFPIEPKGFNRVIVAYEEHLDLAGDSVRYSFPLPDCALELLHLTVALPKDEARSDRWSPEKGAARSVVNGRIVYEQAWEETRGPGGEAVLAWVPADERVQAAAGPDPTRPGAVYTARVRPPLAAEVESAWAERAVFLLDTSLSEHPDRFNADLAILRRILEQDAAIRKFNVMCFDVGAWWLHPEGWLPNDAASRKMVFERLGRVLLEGATDLGGALDLLASMPWDTGRENVNVFLLTDGQLTWGETDLERLVRGFEARAPFTPRFFCYRTGLGAENLELFEALARRGGGVFNVFHEEQAARAALAHRRPCFVVDAVRIVAADGAAGPAARDVVVAGRRAAVYPGGELVVAWRDDRADAAAVTGANYRVEIDGRFQGEARSFAFPVRIARPGELAPRAWAEIAVNQMLATGDPALEPLATAYAQRFRIGSRATSFLVLEKDSDYTEFGIADEAGKLGVEDVGRFLTALHEKEREPVSRKEAFRRFLDRVAGRVGLDASEQAAHVRSLAELLGEDDFALPAGAASGALPEASEADAAYREARDGDRENVNIYLDEASRRKAGDDAFAALRALSTVVELHPGRSDALRLVGYRLLAMDEPGGAARLFDRVRDSRPFEPHSYRDLARSLEAAGRPSLAAIHYEIVLAGTWHERFHDSLKTVVLEEYCRLMRGAIRGRAVPAAVAERFGDRLETLAGTETEADLLVTIAWNTDSTDVDLWVVDPSGEACGYNHKETRMGGQLLDDLTGGYGPERFRLPKAAPGEYAVLVHYFSTNPNLLAGETHVDVTVTRRAGTPDAETRRFQAILRQEKQAIEVCRLRF